MEGARTGRAARKENCQGLGGLGGAVGGAEGWSEWASSCSSETSVAATTASNGAVGSGWTEDSRYWAVSQLQQSSPQWEVSGVESVALDSQRNSCRSVRRSS